MTSKQAIEIASRAVEKLGPRVARSPAEIARLAGQPFYFFLGTAVYPASDGPLVPERWIGRDFWVIAFVLLEPPDYENMADPDGPVVFLDDNTQEIELPMQL